MVEEVRGWEQDFSELEAQRVGQLVKTAKQADSHTTISSNGQGTAGDHRGCGALNRRHGSGVARLADR
jgi:hypothetical protein